MACTDFGLAPMLAGASTFGAQSAASDQLSVATYVPPGQPGAGSARQYKRAVQGMAEVCADYTAGGIDNAEEIYNAINK